jgi:hypothetical protein
VAGPVVAEAAAEAKKTYDAGETGDLTELWESAIAGVEIVDGSTEAEVPALSASGTEIVEGETIYLASKDPTSCFFASIAFTDDAATVTTVQGGSPCSADAAKQHPGLTSSS